MKKIEKEISEVKYFESMSKMFEDSISAHTILKEKENEYNIKDKLISKSLLALENFKENKRAIEELREKIDHDIEIQNSKNIWEYEYKGVKIIVREGDLTEELSTAIVNPANEYLRHEGGAAKAIASKAGDQFTTDCNEYISKYGKLPIGNAMITAAGGDLYCDKVIHAVGPIYRRGSLDNSLAIAKLTLCIDQILNIVKDKDMKSISIPAISTGIFNFPVERCAKILGKTTKNIIDVSIESFQEKEIIFCNNDSFTSDAFKTHISSIFCESSEHSCNNRMSEDDDNEESEEDSGDE